jgi:hypothetical protein
VLRGIRAHLLNRKFKVRIDRSSPNAPVYVRVDNGLVLGLVDERPLLSTHAENTGGILRMITAQGAIRVRGIDLRPNLDQRFFFQKFRVAGAFAIRESRMGIQSQAVYTMTGRMLSSLRATLVIVYQRFNLRASIFPGRPALACTATLRFTGPARVQTPAPVLVAGQESYKAQGHLRLPGIRFDIRLRERFRTR